MCYRASMTCDGPETTRSNSMPAVDLIRLSDLYGLDDVASAASIIDDFLLDFAPLITRLTNAVDASDRRALSETAHSAAGAARYVAAGSLAEQLRALERGAETAPLEQLSACLRAVTEEVNCIVAQRRSLDRSA